MPARLLLVVGSNPPSQTSGRRTLGRVEQARVILGFEDARLVNLFGGSSYRSGGVSELGVEPTEWLAARTDLEIGLASASAVLLAYGMNPPTGRARSHFRDQVEWLDSRTAALSLPSWWVGGGPRHPSRWQRYTWREFPGMPYLDALGLALRQRDRTYSDTPLSGQEHSAETMVAGVER